MHFWTLVLSAARLCETFFLPELWLHGSHACIMCLSSSSLTFRKTNVTWARKTGFSEVGKHLSYNLRTYAGQVKAGTTALRQYSWLCCKCYSLKWTHSPLTEEKSTEGKNKTQPNHTQSIQPHSIGLYTEYIWGKEDSHNPCGRLAGAQPVQGSIEMWIMEMAWTLFSAQSLLFSQLRAAHHAQLSVPQVLNLHECPAGIHILSEKAAFNLVFQLWLFICTVYIFTTALSPAKFVHECIVSFWILVTRLHACLFSNVVMKRPSPRCEKCTSQTERVT